MYTNRSFIAVQSSELDRWVGYLRSEEVAKLLSERAKLVRRQVRLSDYEQIVYCTTYRMLDANLYCIAITQTTVFNTGQNESHPLCTV